MSASNANVSRRDFIRTAGAAGVGAALAPLDLLNPTRAEGSTSVPGQTRVPTRPFGKSGVDVSILALGGVLRSSDQMVFKQAINWGVTYWDTADSYGWGKNETAIGQYLGKYPDHRGQIFLVTKSATSNPKELTEKLHTSLERMQTSYVDMYFIHYVGDVAEELTTDVQRWAERAKAEGKIRLFGFSAHKNMPASMLAAAKLGWIDGIMMSYNYRLMVTDDMRRAVDACVAAGIGLTAMKTQAAFSANFYAAIGSETDDALNMTKKFLSKGYTAEQAKLKVVWENPAIASICSAMPNMTILRANIAAALNKQSLSDGDRHRLNQYARITAPGYCAGCTRICESAVDAAIPIGDILRYAMYHRSYNDRSTASRLFKQLPAEVRANLLTADYSAAEQCCPQRMPIGDLMRQTAEALA